MVADISRKKRIEELHKKHKTELTVVENETMSLAVEEEEKRLKAEEENVKLKAQLDELKDENYSLLQLNESYRVFAKENADLRKVCNNRVSITNYPKTSLEVVQYFDATFGDKIAFSDDVYNSLKDCNITNDKLWETLFALSTIMQDLYVKGGTNIFQEFRIKSGIDVSNGEGSMTRKDKKLMRQFEIEYNGEMIDIEAHITFSRIKQSIHFGFSEKDQKLVVVKIL